MGIDINKNNLGQQCIDAFKETLMVSSIAFYDINDELQPTNFLLYNMKSSLHQEYLNKYQTLDPLRPRQCIKIEQPVIPLQLALSHSACNEKSLYNSFLAHYHIKDITEIIVTNTSGKPTVGISLLRNYPLNNFSAIELETLSGMQILLRKILVDYTPSFSPIKNLTKKEQDIIMLLKKGLTNKELAKNLCVEVSTIKTHLNNLFRKFEVRTRSELISHLFSH